MAEAKKPSKAKRPKAAAGSRKTTASKRKAPKAKAKRGAAQTRAATSSRKTTASKRKAPKAGARTGAASAGASASRARSADLPGELLKSVEDGQRAAIDAVRAFVDTVDRALPRRGEAAARRQEVIDSALDLADRLVQNQFDFLRKVIKSAGKTLAESAGRGNGRRGRKR
jgi:hypothetical protein